MRIVSQYSQQRPPNSCDKSIRRHTLCPTHHLPSLERLCHNCQNRASSYFCHSGLDPESSAFSDCSDTGCRIKSGMTSRNQTIFRNTTQPLTGRDRGEGDQKCHSGLNAWFDILTTKGSSVFPTVQLLDAGSGLSST